jgi:hypothetical protein
MADCGLEILEACDAWIVIAGYETDRELRL